MPVALLDVNVLFSLAWADHVHHEAAHQWFNARRAQGWETCPMTQCSFVLLSSNPRVSFLPKTPSAAVDLLSRVLSFPDHIFWPDDVGVLQVMGAGKLNVIGHLQVADAYLIGLAIAHNGILATFDRRAASLAPGSVEVIDPLSVSGV